MPDTQSEREADEPTDIKASDVVLKFSNCDVDDCHTYRFVAGPPVGALTQQIVQARSNIWQSITSVRMMLEYECDGLAYENLASN